jgi:eukaryotic-like serine/threonine-protein kinase
MIGTTLGNFRIVARIGAGGMGEVWLAEHQLLGSRAAIKVLLPETSGQPRFVDRFFAEARAASRIQDPGIVTVLDFGWHEGRAYIVMEYLQGQSLAARLGMDRLPEVEAVRIIQQCAISMAAAHAAGIIHRDLKPDNIFLVADPAVPGGERVKILDFGIAKLLDDPAPSGTATPRTVTGTIMGTPSYMSPEQCRGAGDVDHRTDIYSLGCVLFQLVTGRVPFIAPTPGEMIASHLRQEPPVPSSLVAGLSPALDALIARCLAKDPEQRFATMTELVRAGAEITGVNRSIATLPPRRASSVGGATVATGAVTPEIVRITTLAEGTGSAPTGSAPPRRAWPLVLGSVAVVGAVAIAFVLASSGAPVASPPPPPAPVDARAVSAAADAPPLVDAAVARPPADAHAAHVIHRPPPPPPPAVPRPDAAIDPYGSR